MAAAFRALVLLLVFVSSAVTDDSAALEDCLSVNYDIVKDACSEEGIPCFSNAKIRHFKNIESAIEAFAKRSCRLGYSYHEIKLVFCCHYDSCKNRCKYTPLPYQPKRERHYSNMTYH